MKIATADDVVIQSPAKDCIYKLHNPLNNSEITITFESNKLSEIRTINVSTYDLYRKDGNRVVIFGTDKNSRLYFETAVKFYDFLIG